MWVLILTMTGRSQWQKPLLRDLGITHRNSRTRTLAASRDIADFWRSKMVPTKRQNNGGIGDQLTRAKY